MRRLIFGIAVTLALVSSLVPSVAFALTSANVTVTGVPSFIAITNSPNTWTINGIDGSGFIQPDTKYYANPNGSSGDVTEPAATVADADCQFTVTNVSSSVALDLTVNWGNFSNGDAMKNSDDKTANGANTFAAASYCTGMTYANAPDAKVTGSSVMKDELTAATLKWGLYIETQTDPWTSGTAMTSTVTITATAD